MEGEEVKPMPFRHEIEIRRLLRLLRAELFRFQEYISPSVQRFKHYFVGFVTFGGQRLFGQC